MSIKETISREEFNNMDREVLYTLFTGMQEQLKRSDETIDALRMTVDKLNEQLKILNSRMFGKSTEKSLATGDQLSIYDFGFNEAEATAHLKLINEPEMETIVVHRKKRKGKLVCDGYQVYHTLENDSETDFTVAGCWIHARRPFADVIKSLGPDKAAGTLAYEAYVQIQNIYHTDNALKKLPPSDRKKKRKKLVKPLVDEFFDWAGKAQYAAAGSDKTRKGIQYCLNQEKYLRAFLDDPAIPLDNNIAEQAIRPFCVGRNNWKLIDTINGANASAIIYSIVETAKANDLNIYKYLKYLLTEIPQHMDDTDTDFIEDLLPWSKSLPPECRKKKASN